MKFEGKSVVLTGASSGMGWEIAKMFASEGATVVAVARRKERLEQLAKETEKLQRKQAKEQKRVDKLTKRMEKMQLQLGTAATMENTGGLHGVGGKKEENARIKREQLKRKVDVTPAQEDQIISEVLREFLA